MSAATSPKSKNWLLAKSRQWHTWGGLIAAAFLLVAGLTGIVLNYKRPILTALGLEAPVMKPRAGTKGTEGRRTAATLSGFPVSHADALRIAGEEFGDSALERLELKREQGIWMYKVKAEAGQELWISAGTGQRFLKGAYEKVQRMEAAGPVKSFDWGKLLLDLHTGKIGGAVGQAVMTVVAALLLWLTVSGLYVYLKPRLLRRESQQRRVAPLPAPAAPAMPSTAAVRQV